MDKETKTTNIYQALMDAQKEMGPLLKNATNPAFRSKYADLSSVIETITEPLQNNGIFYYQSIDIENGQPVLKTRLYVVNGNPEDEWIGSTCPIVCKDPNDPQKFGAAVTYMRRYSLMALLGLAPEDDDGNSAATPSTATQVMKTPARASTATHTATTDSPLCPVCHGPMWDNRPKKASGEFSPTAPDFKCKDKECGGVIWPPKNGNGKENIEAQSTQEALDEIDSLYQMEAGDV